MGAVSNSFHLAPDMHPLATIRAFDLAFDPARLARRIAAVTHAARALPRGCSLETAGVLSAAAASNTRGQSDEYCQAPMCVGHGIVLGSHRLPAVKGRYRKNTGPVC